MDFIFWKSFSNYFVLGGAIITFLGVSGQLYFGKKVKEITPFRQPINTASATVEVVVESDENVDTHYIDRGGYLIFAKDNNSFMGLSSIESDAKQIGNNQVMYKGVFSMDVNDTANGKPIIDLADTDYLQIFFYKIPAKKKILKGKVVCTINGQIRFKASIPEQIPVFHDDDRKDNNLILIKDLSNVFKDFK